MVIRRILTTLLLFGVLPAMSQTIHDTLPSADIKRIEGSGNGGFFLKLNASTTDSIITHGYCQYPVYKADSSPIAISVYDTGSVTSGTYQVKLDSVFSYMDSATWKMYRVGSTDTVYNTFGLRTDSVQYISAWGIVATIRQAPDSIDFFKALYNHPVIGSDIQFGGNGTPWLTGLDGHNSPFLDWFDFHVGDDSSYLNILSGWIAPYHYMIDSVHSPLATDFLSTTGLADLQNMDGIDIVITPDQSLWTRCAVVEMQDDTNQSFGNAKKQLLRTSPSVDKNGVPDGTGTGMSWFPGYAINIQKGVRLNMAFGENSADIVNNGQDMIWNPTANLMSGNDTVLGGKHYLFVFDDEKTLFGPASDRMPYYDSAQFLVQKLSATTSGQQIKAWRSCRYVGLPLASGNGNLLDSPVKIRIRNASTFFVFDFDMSNSLNNQNPMYEFEIVPNLSIEESIDPLTFNLYPNPAVNKVTLLMDSPNSSVLIFDQQGSIVYKSAFTKTIDISQLSAGNYYIAILDHGRITARSRFVKN